MLRKKPIKMFTLLIALVLSANTFASEDSKKGIYWDSSNEDIIKILINWCEAKAEARITKDCAIDGNENWSNIQPRVDADDVVSVKVSNFNFIAYEVDFSIEETEVKAYTYLLSLWSQVLNPLDSLFSASGEVRAEEIDDWRTALSGFQNNLKKKVDEFTVSEVPYLLESELDSLKVRVDEVSKELKIVENFRRITSDMFTQSQSREKIFRNKVEAGIQLVEKEKEQFAKVIGKNQDLALQIKKLETEHEEIAQSAKHFIRLGIKTINGHSERIGRKKEGFVIDVNMKSKAREEITSLVTVKPQEIDFSYMVKTTSPLLFHAGVIHANLNDVDYEVIRAATGDDFFVKTKDNENVQYFSAFVSTPIDGKAVEEARWYATLGTDFKDVGENIYGGISYQVTDRWFFSAGVAYGLVKNVSAESETTLSDDVEPSRTLYQIVEEERETSWFVSVSYQVF